VTAGRPIGRARWHPRLTSIKAWLAFVVLLTACGNSTAPGLAPSSSSSRAVTTASPISVPAASPSTELGPGGLTLDEEVGAVIMAGFQGPLTEAVVADWTRRQFGGLLVVNLNHNATTPAALAGLIARLRATVRHRLIAATDQEGGDICIALSSIPCDPMPVGLASSTRMATAIHAVGFDLDLGPVADVCNGPHSIMAGRCYGTDPAVVAAAVGAAVDGIHAGHMLAAAKHFPGHGSTPISSETQLPRIDASLATLEARDWPPFVAASAHGADLILLGHLFIPALDPSRSADLSPATFAYLRGPIGFRGVVISDDMEMGAITATTPAPIAAVQFLQAGGDLVMIAHDLGVADATYDAIRAAVIDGRLARARLDDAVAAIAALPSR